MRVIKKLNTLNLHLFLYPQNICAHFSIVLTKNRRHTTSCKYDICGGLEEAVISSDQITEIPNEAFADCNALNIIKLPANLERIGERAFIGTGNLGAKEGLTIPSKVREIDAEAFYKSLFDAVDIVLPASLTNIYGHLREVAFE